VERWTDFHLLPEFVDILKRVRSHGYVAVVVTNQRGVARGIMPLSEVDGIHARLRDRLRSAHGTDVLDILCCPHDRGECECRKPKPGMLLAAAERHGLDLSASWMIGDSETDVEAGRAAGCRTVLVSSDAAGSAADVTVPDMGALRARIDELLA
jgi:histidinol-phosphate phosphatase family protein